MIAKPKVRDAARNRWKSILPILCIESGYLTGKHGPCPLCQDGSDRWRFDDKDGSGSWICSKCGAGDGVALVMAALKLDFKDAAVTIEAVLGNCPAGKPAPARDVSKDREKMNAVWTSGRTLDAMSVAGRYLTARTGLTTFCADLRAVAKLPHYELDSRVPTHHPALIAMVRDPDGKPINIHRTYLAPEGGKADLAEPRKAMVGTIAHGSAVRLAPFEDVLGIAEGIETALSASILHNMPVWAALTAVGVEQWQPPPDVRVFVFGDNDPSYQGQKSAYVLAARLRKEKRQVDVVLPTRWGDDFNDVLARQNAQPAEAAA